MRDDRLFSLVVPVLNEEEVLAETAATLTGVLERLGRPYEVIVVDNASTDRTPAIAAELCRRDPRWRYLRLSRNFGYQNSITAGMLAAQGEAVMVIDADLQDPPELIPEFVRKWEEGHDVVYGVRVRRLGEPWWRTVPTRLAMRFLTWVSDDVKLPAHSGDFRLISRRARDAYALMPETNRYVRGLIHWLGFRQVGIPYTRRGRQRGTGKWGVGQLIGFTCNAAINFSVKPVRLFTLLGVGFLGLTGVLTLLWLLGWPALAGAGLHLLLLLNLGVVSLGLGVVGEYVAKIHSESKHRPLWLVDYTVNMAAEARGRVIRGAVRLPGPAAEQCDAVLSSPARQDAA
jgi:dolichol-phosphate mannosyltransferase